MWMSTPMHWLWYRSRVGSYVVLQLLLPELFLGCIYSRREAFCFTRCTIPSASDSFFETEWPMKTSKPTSLSAALVLVRTTKSHNITTPSQMLKHSLLNSRPSPSLPTPPAQPQSPHNRLSRQSVSLLPHGKSLTHPSLPHPPPH